MKLGHCQAVPHLFLLFTQKIIHKGCKSRSVTWQSDRSEMSTLALLCVFICVVMLENKEQYPPPVNICRLQFLATKEQIWGTVYHIIKCAQHIRYQKNCFSTFFLFIYFFFYHSISWGMASCMKHYYCHQWALWCNDLCI